MKKICVLALVLLTATVLTTACQKKETAAVALVEQSAPVVQADQAAPAAPIISDGEPAAAPAENTAAPATSNN